MSRFPNPSVLRHLAAVLCAGSLAVIAACGGGGEPMAASPGAAAAERATAFAAGPITGFGSVIVNGIRFDDTGAAVTDDDDRARSREMLRLGMLVEIDGVPMAGMPMMGAGGDQRALRIRYGSQIVGPVSAKNATSLTVLGQTVDIGEATVFDDGIAGGLDGVAIGAVVEVHAMFDASTGHWTARRIDSATGATTYKLRGVVARLDTTARTFEVGGQLVSYAGLAAGDLPPGLADGLPVTVRLDTTPLNGAWVATAVRASLRPIDNRPDAALRGAITGFTSATAFEVNGLKVDAANAVFPDGRDGLGSGVLVEVKGAIVDGVLVATRVELDGRHAPQRHAFELHGLVASLDTAAKTFVLRNVKVGYAGKVTWVNGREEDLANGSRVEVRGVPSADRTRLDALVIAFGR